VAIILFVSPFLFFILKVNFFLLKFLADSGLFVKFKTLNDGFPETFGVIAYLGLVNAEGNSIDESLSANSLECMFKLLSCSNYVNSFGFC